jgi:chorismate binding enzyme
VSIDDHCRLQVVSDIVMQVDRGTRWLRLHDPERVIDVRDVADLDLALREIEHSGRTRGWHAAGFVTYEAPRRGRTLAEDDLAARRLHASAKERAENVMIVDMMRNDLGRIAETGSVTVLELLAVERYPTIWQMTSTVSAQSTAPRSSGSPSARLWWMSRLDSWSPASAASSCGIPTRRTSIRSVS